MNQISFIKKILSFSPRQLEGETKTVSFIKKTLEKEGFSYKEQKFKTKIPEIKKAVLFADGKKIPCMGTSFTSGKIEGKENLVSSLIPSRFLSDVENINFNPECPKEISCSNYYRSPSLSVSRKDIMSVLKADNVKGEVIVEAKKHTSSNILVGNIKNPKIIIFAHYDSINAGAVDNASGVSAIMKTIIANPKTLINTLYVFAGNEELSYDKPTYWGRGYRFFEKKFANLMQKAKKIIVVDSVGNGKTQISQNPKLQYLAFPIENLKKFQRKTFIVFGDFKKLMAVYHSNADDIKRSGIKEKYLEESVKKIVSLIN